ncbi:C40 family peptidase [Kitasatospora sp. NPDC057015]|uniref:C40 family peptidase n=1 Tax=Kitasatospora sp. NPDC057015 TaxID=3346001 RepID=UPI00363149D2
MNTVVTGAPSAPQTEPTTAISAERARSHRIARIGRIRRGLGLVAVIAAGAGVIGLGSSVGTAAAEPAPAHAGWDGSKYWFRDAQGQWRWTSHYDVYQQRTGAGGGGAVKVSSGGGITQGWDGSVYWFRNAQGQWRWTSHYDVYQQRTGTGGGGAVKVSSGGGITQGWDGSVYWFRNAQGQWRWTSHYDVYQQRTGVTAAPASSDTAAAPAAAASGDFEDAVAFALAQLGKPFKTAGNGPDGYDCSGLVQQAFRRAGVELPRVANDQYEATTPVSAGQLRRGDLLFWSEDGTARGIEHVAIYLGGNQYVEAARPGTNIRVSTISSGYYPDYMGRP